MRILVDTGATVNTGNHNYYLWVMSQYPTIVAEQLECSEETKYEIIQLLATLDLNVVSQPHTHGNMTVVIRYHTQFFVNKKD